MMSATKIAIAAITGGVIAVSGNSYAQKADFGRSEYNSSCAICHGKRGEGDGPYVSLGYAVTADLTTLAKRNNGVFPFQRIYEFIDGRQMVRAHGEKDMPIWGNRYTPTNPEGYFVGPEYFNSEAVVQIRILSLTEYIYRLQVK
jgi:mono/diheme cytochrome c family protein